jgi:hypothetical protein
MARKVILDTYYTFVPSTRTITIPRAVQRERFALITNVNTNQVIYNFSDPNLKLTSHGIVTDYNSGVTTTTITLNYNTASMQATDKLQIVIDEFEETFKPTEILTDPVNKLRTSTGQALIDTDFEYGQQSTKWETITLVNNRPFAYYNTTLPLNLADVRANVGSRQIQVNTYPQPPLPQGNVVYMQDTSWVGAEGIFIVDQSDAGSNTFTYTAEFPYINASSSILNSGVTTAYQGYIFSNAAIQIQSITSAQSLVTVVTNQPHGLSLGNEIALTGTSASSNAPNGSFFVCSIPSTNVFTFYTYSGSNTIPTGSITGGSLFVRPQGQALHRAYDGGIQFGTNSQSPNQSIVRQTRRYFRYQSGKGIQMSTGTLMKPSINLDQITSVGNLITVVTKNSHGIINPNVSFTIAGCVESGYNGTWTVANVLDAYRFQYYSNTTPTITTASGQFTLSITGWYGAVNRVGMFDQQNGLFWEFDGQTLYAVRRSSTYQLSGQIQVASNSSYVAGQTFNGVSTLFSKQLTPGDYVVIKGQSYLVDSIQSDNQLQISPQFRHGTGATVINTIMSKTVNTRIPQSQFNIDRLDGTGPSGYNLDLSKMQMWYIDYSWYGAGFVRWGIRGTDGNVIYCHKMLNNNANYEAYMRSGNLPARYESSTLTPFTYLTASLDAANTVAYCNSAAAFPNTGTLWIRNAANTEFITYSGRTSNTFTGLVRGQRGANSVIFNTTANSVTMTGADTTGIQIGQFVFGNNIPNGAYVTNINPNTSVNMSYGATGTGTALAIFAPLGNTAQSFVYSATAPTQIQLHTTQFAPALSHWGTSVIMDGRFDDDKSFVFTQGMTTAMNVTNTFAPVGQSIVPGMALQSFRVSPSVGNGIAGASLGSREIINRMQMVLRTIDMLATGTFLIRIVLNGLVSNNTPQWQTVGGSSLAQYINHNSNTFVTGGETIFAAFTNASGGLGNYTVTTYDLPLVRDLGNSIRAGGSPDPTVGIYPDGPDMVTIVAQNLTGQNAQIFSRLSWTEAQA